MLQTNRLKEILRSGLSVIGSFVSMPEPGIIEAIGYSGFDFVVIDMEHSPIDFGHLRYLLSAADNVGLTPLVRLGTCEANPILRVLDCGAFGVMAAHVKNKDIAQDFVSACKYPPDGNRGISGGSRAAGYGKTRMADHVKLSNQEVLTIALIEDKPGLEAIEDIVQTPGLDVVFPGPGDLSASLGYPGQSSHFEVHEAVNRIAEVVHSHPGIFLGYHIMEPEEIIRCRELEAQFIIFSQDSRMLYHSYRKALEEIRRLL